MAGRKPPINWPDRIAVDLLRALGDPAACGTWPDRYSVAYGAGGLTIRPRHATGTVYAVRIEPLDAADPASRDHERFDSAPDLESSEPG